MKATTRLLFPVRTRVALLLLLLPASSLFAAGEFTLDTARAAADKGDAAGGIFLARALCRWSGVPRDYTKAVEYLRQSAEQGTPQPRPASAPVMRTAWASSRIMPKRSSGIARRPPQGDSLAAILPWAMLMPMARACQRMLMPPLNGGRNPPNRARSMRKTPWASFIFYGEHPGDTNHVNYAEAAQWLRKAAEQGYAPAMSTLGFYVSIRLGVGRDWSQALKWNRRAAELGDATAQDNLGQMYENGYAGLPHDLVQAYKWFWLSEQQGNPAGRHDVMEIELHHALTPEQIDEAKRLAAEFHSPDGDPPVGHHSGGPA